MGWTPNPRELEMLEQEERERREALDAARQKHTTDDGVVPEEHHDLIQKLETEWKKARDLLERHRSS